MMTQYLSISRRAALAAVAAFSFLAISAPRADAASDPQAMVQEVSSKILSLLQSGASTSELSATTKSLLESNADLDAITRFVLGRYGRGADAGDIAKFRDVFSNYVAQTWAARLGEYSGQTIEVSGQVDHGDKGIVVNSMIRGSGDPIKVDWQLKDRGGEWKIVDLNVAGISMVISQREEFATILSRNGGKVSELTTQLQSKLKK